MIQRSRRGQGETAKEHQANLQKTKEEVQQFLDANNLGRPQSPAEWRQCYRELGNAGVPDQHTTGGDGDPGGPHHG